MEITKEHLVNARSHAVTSREAALYALGEAAGTFSLLAELEKLLTLPEPPQSEPLAPEDHDFVIPSLDKE